MAEYRITIKKSAAKELQAIPQKDMRKIVMRIRSLARNPRHHGSQKLAGQEQYRIRQGDYRIVYFIEDKETLIDIIKIGHRREVYRS